MSTSLAIRRAECERVLAKHPNTCPVVLVGAKNQKCVVISLAPTATVADIDAAVREVAVFGKKSVNLTVDGCTLSSSTVLAELYSACKSEDGYLYVHFSGEKKLGGAMALPCFSMGGDTDGKGYQEMVNDATAGLKQQMVDSATKVATEEAQNKLQGLGGLGI